MLTCNFCPQDKKEFNWICSCSNLTKKKNKKIMFFKLEEVFFLEAALFLVSLHVCVCERARACMHVRFWVS